MAGGWRRWHPFEQPNCASSGPLKLNKLRVHPRRGSDAEVDARVLRMLENFRFDPPLRNRRCFAEEVDILDELFTGSRSLQKVHLRATLSLNASRTSFQELLRHFAFDVGVAELSGEAADRQRAIVKFCG